MLEKRQTLTKVNKEAAEWISNRAASRPQGRKKKNKQQNEHLRSDYTKEKSTQQLFIRDDNGS